MSRLVDAGISWIICGQQTPVRTSIPRKWVDEVVSCADEAGIPVFEKDNLREHCLTGTLLRRKWPAQSRQTQTAAVREGHDDQAADASQ